MESALGLFGVIQCFYLWMSFILSFAFCLYQIYFCLRTGYYDEARNIALSSRASNQFAPLVLIVHYLIHKTLLSGLVHYLFILLLLFFDSLQSG